MTRRLVQLSFSVLRGYDCQLPMSFGPTHYPRELNLADCATIYDDFDLWGRFYLSGQPTKSELSLGHVGDFLSRVCLPGRRIFSRRDAGLESCATSFVGAGSRLPRGLTDVTFEDKAYPQHRSHYVVVWSLGRHVFRKHIQGTYICDGTLGETIPMHSSESNIF